MGHRQESGAYRHMHKQSNNEKYGINGHSNKYKNNSNNKNSINTKNDNYNNNKMASNAIGKLLAKTTKVMRVPPSRTNANAINAEKADVRINGECLSKLKQEAQQAFTELECKLNAITALMADDRNV
uniref:Uncharacterized protein n=1 Tax=Glossina austeni TaxID=7395 RepID=A0A1A9VMT3_GLOAU